MFRLLLKNYIKYLLILCISYSLIFFPLVTKAFTYSHLFQSFQRSTGDNEDGTKALIYDLEEILELKATIDQIKEEATDPHLDAESKLNKLKELQDALERLQNLRADVIKTEAIEEGTLKTKGNIEC